MRIKDLEALSGNPTSGQKLAIDTSDGTFQIDYNALANAIISKLGGDPVTVGHGGTGATTAAAARANIGLDFAIYNSVTDIGLTSGSATILTAFNALGNNAALYATGNDFAASALPTGAQTGTVEIVRHLDGRAHVMFYGKDKTVGDWRMPLGSTTYNGNDSNLPSGIWYPDPTTCRGGSGETGTTLRINFEINSSLLLMIAGNGPTRTYLGIVTVLSSGSTSVQQIYKGNDISIATNTNYITATGSSGTELAFVCYPIRGKRFTTYSIS